MNVPLGWKQNYSYQKTPAPTPLIANGSWLGWPWQIRGTRVQVSRFMWFVLVLLTGICVYNNPSPNTDSLSMEFWYPWIYFCVLWEFLFQVTLVLSPCCWEYFRNRGIGSRRKEGECKAEQWAVLTKPSWRKTWVPSYVPVCSGKGIGMCLT